MRWQGALLALLLSGAADVDAKLLRRNRDSAQTAATEKGFVTTAHATDSVALITKLAQLTYTKVQFNKFAVDLGAGDGVSAIPGFPMGDARWGDPIYPLYTQFGWGGLAIEGNPNMLTPLTTNVPSPTVAKKIAMIYPTNVVKLLEEANTPKDMDYFKNDIDSYDCAVTWAVLAAGYKPKVIQMEVNPEIPYPIAFGVNFDPNFKPALGLGGFYGCSVAMSSGIVRSFGYRLVGVGYTHDVFYVREDIAEQAGPAGFPDVSDAVANAELEQCCVPHHFGIGTSESWSLMAKTNPSGLLTEMQKAMPYFCGASQQTGQQCSIPFTLSLNPVDYVQQLQGILATAAGGR